jgi:catechol 2,3-dioxygenase-like lactoylglutathione lyase family enzyme
MELDHVTIRTRDLQATRNFFQTVFDLKEGARPLAIHLIPATGFIPRTICSSTSSARKGPGTTA